MNFSKGYFGKDIEELIYEDIENFFTEERLENTRIEFKSFSLEHGDFKKNLGGIVKSICAFLNSEGGIIIWGAPAGKIVESNKEKVFIGELSPLKVKKEKDGLINKISDSITPMPRGVKVEILEQNDNIVYIFEVQKSAYSPHQYKDIYWARLDGQTKPAPHYLVDALFKQVSYPNLESYIKLDGIKFHRGSRVYIDSGCIIQISIITLNFSPYQNEENVFVSLMNDSGYFKHLTTINPLELHQNPETSTISSNIDILHYGKPNIFSVELTLDPYHISSCDKSINLILYFGGKKSPLKLSTYELDLRKVANGSNDLNQLIVKKEENILSVDRKEALGISKESSLKDLLGRQV